MINNNDMEKKVTKEEVERVLNLYICYTQRVDNILNELFPPEFKVGDWVKVKAGVSIESNDLDGKVVKLTRVGSKYVSAEKTDRLAGMHFNEVRHATPEEIAAAEWEEGKPYKVWREGEAIVYISSEKVGFFYGSGRFEGKSYKFEKYEKL